MKQGVIVWHLKTILFYDEDAFINVKKILNGLEVALHDANIIKTCQQVHLSIPNCVLSSVATKVALCKNVHHNNLRPSLWDNFAMLIVTYAY